MHEISKDALDLRAMYRTDQLGARAKIMRAIELAKGNEAQAARLLGIGYRTLRRYVEDDKVLADSVARARETRKAAQP